MAGSHLRESAGRAHLLCRGGGRHGLKGLAAAQPGPVVARRARGAQRYGIVIGGTLLAILVGAWLAFLFFQHGHAWDEAEHGHAAWLMSRGKRPLEDFFQHHPPLLWSLLALYYRAGLQGPAVLVWGRCLVVLSGVVAVASLLAIGRSAERGASLGRGLGVVWFIGLTVALPELFVIRPETIAAACCLAACALWCNEAPRWAALAAGVLAGAAFYSSPRLLLVGGVFVLLGRQSVGRWASLIAGAVSFWLVYTAVSGFGLAKVIFDLQFSAYLQTVGDRAVGLSFDYLDRIALLAALPSCLLLFPGMRGERPGGMLLLAYTVVVMLVCRRAAGLFNYAQAYAPAVVAAAVSAAWIGARASARTGAQAAGVGATFAALLLSWLIVHPALPRFDFFRMLHARNALAAWLPPGASALVYSGQSPISIDDADYYGNPLVDSQDRLCRAIRGFTATHPSATTRALPECDFSKVLNETRPYLTELGISRTVRASDRRATESIVDADYATPAAAIAAAWQPYFRGIVLRKETRAREARP